MSKSIKKQLLPFLHQEYKEFIEEFGYEWVIASQVYNQNTKKIIQRKFNILNITNQAKIYNRKGAPPGYTKDDKDEIQSHIVRARTVIIDTYEGNRIATNDVKNYDIYRANMFNGWRHIQTTYALEQALLANPLYTIKWEYVIQPYIDPVTLLPKVLEFWGMVKYNGAGVYTSRQNTLSNQEMFITVPSNRLVTITNDPGFSVFWLSKIPFKTENVNDLITGPVNSGTPSTGFLYLKKTPTTPTSAKVTITVSGEVPKEEEGNQFGQMKLVGVEDMGFIYHEKYPNWAPDPHKVKEAIKKKGSKPFYTVEELLGYKLPPIPEPSNDPRPPLDQDLDYYFDPPDYLEITLQDGDGSNSGGNDNTNPIIVTPGGLSPEPVPDPIDPLDPGIE